MNKQMAEFIGTFSLVLFGGGAAVLAGGDIGLTGSSFAFGLALVGMADGGGGTCWRAVQKRDVVCGDTAKRCRRLSGARALIANIKAVYDRLKGAALNQAGSALEKGRL